MFVIFGTRGVTSTEDRGAFFCPRCEDERAYRKKRVRRFFTLFFVPVVPLDRVAEYVECEGCGGTFDDAVLSWDPREAQRQFEAEFQKAMKTLMLHMLLADDRIDDAEVRTVCEIYNRLSGGSVSADEVAAEAVLLSASDADPVSVAAAFGPRLNDTGKEMVVQAGLQVASADGHVGDEEMALLRRIAKAMEMSDRHLRGVLGSPLGV